MSSRVRLAGALAALLALAVPATVSDARADTKATGTWTVFEDLSGLAREARALLYRADALTVVPVNAEVTSDFGFRRDPINRRRRLHRGIDFDADRGTLVHAAAAGRVITARRKGGYGKVVIIDHGNGLETRYAHLSKLLVERGDLVRAGAEIARVGSSGRVTGPHLHFEVWRDGKAIDPRRELALGDDAVIVDRTPGS
jgi:murein DD-endopeptidase MepM/ murein hydrolase activator NlpD